MNRKGFTLLEVLISVAILAAMSLLMYSGLHRSLEAKQKVEWKDEGVHSARIAINKMTEDLSQAFTANSLLKGQDSRYETGFKGTAEGVDFSTFSHLHYARDAKDTDSVTVGYSLERNDAGLSDLYRRESTRLSEDLDKGGDSYAILENVKTLKLSYYDSGKTEWVQEWSAASVSTMGRIPQAVKIELTVVEQNGGEEGKEGKEVAYQTMTLLPLYKNEINF